MEADKHDGEDDPAVLVNITAPHPEYSVGRLRRRKGGKRKLDMLRVTGGVGRLAGHVGVLKQETTVRKLGLPSQISDNFEKFFLFLQIAYIVEGTMC